MPSIPFMPGSPMSVKTTSGISRAIFATASSIERKRPTQRNPLVPFISSAKPSRTSRMSSTMATLISGDVCGELVIAENYIGSLIQNNHYSPCTFLQVELQRLPPLTRRRSPSLNRAAQLHACAFSRRRTDFQLATKICRSPFHAQEAIALVVACRVKPRTVVRKTYNKLRVLDFQINTHGGSACVSHDVVERLFEDQVQVAPRV